MPVKRPWFEVLGVPPTSSAEEVRDAYLVLVKTWHPDRFAALPEIAAQAEERVKTINAAYDQARTCAWEPHHETAAHGRAAPPGWSEAEWPEWAETVEPARVRLLFVPGGLTVRAIALMLALLLFFFAVSQALNALSLAFR